MKRIDIPLKSSDIQNKSCLKNLEKKRKKISQRTLDILFQVSQKVYKLLKVYKFKTHTHTHTNTHIPTLQFD